MLQQSRAIEPQMREYTQKLH